jgi:hypothetical protein
MVSRSRRLTLAIVTQQGKRRLFQSVYFKKQKRGTRHAVCIVEDDTKLSQEFPTEEEVWQHADEADLVELVDGKTVLEAGLTIQPCVTTEEGCKPIAVPPPVT